MKRMTTKRKCPKKHAPRKINAHGKPDGDKAVVMARTVIHPTAQAAVTIREYDRSYGDLDLAGLTASLIEQTKAIGDENLSRAEEMLTTQAHTLDAIFNNLARRAINSKYINHLDRYLKLALRAQSQCRATWETLATIKNPPVMGYVKQANIAHGPQQVNNAPPTSEPTRTRENENSQNKLLEEIPSERLDTGTKGTAGSSDSELATLDAVKRTEVRRG